MKTSNLFRFIFLFLAVTGLSLAGCKKDKNTETYPAPVSLQQLSDDDESMESAMNESMNDVNNFLSGGNLKSTERRIPCNASVDSTAIVNDTINIFIDYHGLNCNGTRYRTGKVEIKRQVGTHWFQQGATVMVKHIDFTITKVSNQKSITLNGIKVHQNVSGGVIWQLGNGTSAIVHRTWGQVSVTFNNGSTRIWNIARQKTYTGTAPDSLVLTIDGRQACDWDPSSGIKKHIAPADSKSATLTFGYDKYDAPITGDECPAKYKLDWQKNNHSGTVYLWL